MMIFEGVAGGASLRIVPTEKGADVLVDDGTPDHAIASRFKTVSDARAWVQELQRKQRQVCC